MKKLFNTQDLKNLNQIYSAIATKEKEKIEAAAEEIEEPEVQRECGDCNLCCHGWLYAEVFGQELTYGSPCHYVGCNGCTVYEQRPEDPCRAYKCAWLMDGLFPEWMKPNKSKLIGSWRSWKNNGELEDYIEIAECGAVIKGTDLQWLLTMSEEKDINIMYMVDGKRYAKGSPEFVKWFEEDFEWL
jgi:hypothetical protein